MMRDFSQLLFVLCEGNNKSRGAAEKRQCSNNCPFQNEDVVSSSEVVCGSVLMRVASWRFSLVGGNTV